MTVFAKFIDTITFLNEITIYIPVVFIEHSNGNWWFLSNIKRYNVVNLKGQSQLHETYYDFTIFKSEQEAKESLDLCIKKFFDEHKKTL